MTKQLIIKNPRMLFDHSPSQEKIINLKICVNEKIFCMENFHFNKTSLFWFLDDEIKISCKDKKAIQFEAFYRKQGEKMPVVIGESVLLNNILKTGWGRQLKIALNYDDLNVGWLYFYILGDQVTCTKELPFFHFHKINISFLEDKYQNLRLGIYHNENLIFQNMELRLFRKALSISPKLKQEIRLTDIITIKISSKQIPIKSVTLRVENIRRGKISSFDSWVCNKLGNKIGDISIDYLLDNIYLDNQHSVFKGKGIIPKMKTYPQKEVKSQTDDELIIKQIDQADLKIMKINTHLDKMFMEVGKNNASTPLSKPKRKDKSSSKTFYDFSKEKSKTGNKEHFYFSEQTEKENK